MPADTGHTDSDELRESEARYRALAEGSPLAIFVSREGVVVLANPACVRLFGASTREDLIGRQALELFHPDSRSQASALMHADSEMMPLVEVGIVPLCGADVDVDVEATASPFLDRGVRSIQVVLRDITERKRAEEELRRSSAFLENLFDSANAPMIVWDSELRVTRFNHAFERLTQRSADEVIGHPLDTLFPHATRGASLDQIGLAGRGASLESTEIEILRANGDVRTVLWSSAKVYDTASGDTLLAVIAQGQDITERMRAQQELRESEARYRALAEGSPLAIFVCSRDTVVLANEACVKLLGASSDADLLGSPVLELFSPESRPFVRERLCADGEAVPFVEALIVRLDGSTVEVEAAASPLPGHGAGATQVVLRDITERKDAERALLSRTEELVRSNAELEKFAYIASHDLQEPLRMIASYTQLLQRRYQGKLDDDADEFIGYAVDGALRMQRLINELLAYSRVGSQGAAFSLTDLDEVLDGVLKVLEPSLQAIGAVVTRESLPTVWCDPIEFGQVFQNLIANAAKFHGGGTPRIYIGAHRGGADWVFSVKDNGIGIEPEYFDRIFVIFQRLNARTEYEGTGMGLAICKRIIERHGGRIWIESEPGVGSTFFFTLPEDRKEPAS